MLEQRCNLHAAGRRMRQCRLRSQLCGMLTAQAPCPRDPLSCWTRPRGAPADFLPIPTSPCRTRACAGLYCGLVSVYVFLYMHVAGFVLISMTCWRRTTLSCRWMTLSWKLPRCRAVKCRRQTRPGRTHSLDSSLLSLFLNQLLIF